MPLLVPTVLLLLLTIFPIPSLADAPVSIGNSPIYSSQRDCAKNCFVFLAKPGSEIARQLDCDTGTPMNDCVCRPDLQANANNFVSSCVAKWCSRNDNDVAVATKLYDDYCTKNGYIAVAAVLASTTAAGATTLHTQPSAPTNVPAYPTSTAQSMRTAQSSPPAASSSSKDGGLSRGALIGVICGIVSAVAAVVGVLIKWKAYRAKRDEESPAKAKSDQMYAGRQIDYYNGGYTR